MFTCTLNPSTYFSFANSQALIKVVGRVKRDSNQIHKN